MKTMIFAVAIGAALVSTPGVAQDAGRGGWQQRDLTRAEAQQRADTMFQMFDANRDGTVTRAEAQQALAQFEASRGGGEGRGSGRIQRMIDMAFGSGQSITLQQFEAQALARFESMDLNHDGTVTSAERQQARQQHAQVQGGTVDPAKSTAPAAAVSPRQ